MMMIDDDDDDDDDDESLSSFWFLTLKLKAPVPSKYWELLAQQ